MIGLIIVVVVVVGLGLSIFTTWMFSEAVAEEDPDERSRWVFTVKFLGPIGAVMYYLNRYR